MGEGVELSRAAAGPRPVGVPGRQARGAAPAFSPPAVTRAGRALLLRASVAALYLLLHPYDGLVQDARIYVGRGVADRDPAGVGGELIFRDDAQTGFSLMRGAVAGLLHVATPEATSMVLALVGSLAWIAAAHALARRVARACFGEADAERVAWAMAVAVAALPGQYGAWHVFAYGQTSATPRVFAEAASLAGLCALLGGRRLLGAALLSLAAGLHPIMALPALGLAAAMSVRADRRWLAAAVAAASAIAVAAACGLPLADRLFTAMDPLWSSLLRERSPYLFPSLWPGPDLVAMAPQVAALAVAGSLAGPDARRLLWGAAGVGLAGLAGSLVLGDRLGALLVIQLQTWRALWLLAVLGNASFALAILALVRRGAADRLTAAALVLAWSATDAAAGVLFGAVALALRASAPRLSRARIDPRIVAAAAVLAGAAALAAVSLDAAALLALLRSSAAGDGEVTWSMVSALDVQALPLALGAVLLAARPPRDRRAPALAAAALAAVAAAAALLWDGRTAERRGFEAGSGTAELRDFFAPARGAVFWADETAETWFTLGRPAFLNAVQGGPILFSRDMAFAWKSRMAALQALGLARDHDLAPFFNLDRRVEDVRLTPDAVRGFCADPRRPAGLVVPGRQAAAAPPGFATLSWRPPFAVRHLSVEGDALAWKRTDAFTAVRCPVSPGT